jgi:hypothetical protein
VHLSDEDGPAANGIEFSDYNTTFDAHYAWAVASAGDINGDGFADIIAGEEGGIGVDQNFPGYAHIYFGSANFGANATHIQLDGASDDDRFGCAVASGDFNGDRYFDVLIGAYARDGGGAAYVYLGGPGGIEENPWVTLSAAGSVALGDAVANAGDVNGDGFHDIIVGDGDGLGAHIYFGGEDAPAGTPDHSVSGPANSDFGRAVGTGGDIDRDGYSEFLVGAPGYAIWGSGTVLIWRGATSLAEQSQAPLEYWHEGNASTGSRLGLARDTNGDGHIDIPVAKGYPGDYSGVFVFVGDGSFNYDNDPPELPGITDLGYAVY